MASSSASESSEVHKAQHATAQASETLFEKIIARKIPAKFVHEDELCVAIQDVNPQAPQHFLVIPRTPIARLSQAGPEHKMLLGHLLLTAQSVARAHGIAEDGFRVVINDGRHGAQSVYHLHVHVLGGRQMGWPPG